MSAKGWSAVIAVLILAVYIAGCGNRSGLEGRVVNGARKPLGGLKIIAEQVEPVKGYERFETVTGSDGTFRFSKLFPASEYVLRPWAETWTTETSLRGKSGPEGKTSVLLSPMTIGLAVSRDGRSIIDPQTGAIRFTASSEGVITDSHTSLQWVVRLNQSTDRNQAAWWVMNENKADGGWRLPTLVELRTLYARCLGLESMDSVLETPGRWYWVDLPEEGASLWHFTFAAYDSKDWEHQSSSSFLVFGVRSLPRK